MSKKIPWLAIISVIISFIGGFLIANALNGNEISRLNTEIEGLKKNKSGLNQNNSQDTLTKEEIQKQIAEAEKNPKNFAFQKSLGLALYQYANMKQDKGLLKEVVKLLTRANELNPNDYDVIVSLGNVHFDVWRDDKNSEDLQKARKIYEKILNENPKDINVRTNLGLTYFLSEPPELSKAIAEFKKSLKVYSKHEKTLQFMIQALLKQGSKAEAEDYLVTLKEVNPNNPFLASLKKENIKEADNK